MKDFYKNNGTPTYRSCKWCELFGECSTGQLNNDNQIELTLKSITCKNYAAICKNCGKDISVDKNWQGYCTECHNEIIKNR